MTIRHLKQAVLALLTHAARTYRYVVNRNSAAMRRVLGIGFIVGGFLAVLPIFGLWMLPVGLALLSDDIPMLRRLRRRAHARLLAWAQNRKRRTRRPNAAESQPRLRQELRPERPAACNTPVD